MLGLQCGLVFVVIIFKVPQVILIAARIENSCLGQWGATGSLKQGVAWGRTPQKSLSVLFPRGREVLGLGTRGALSRPVTVLLSFVWGRSEAKDLPVTGP